MNAAGWGRPQGRRVKVTLRRGGQGRPSARIDLQGFRSVQMGAGRCDLRIGVLGGAGWLAGSIAGFRFGLRRLDSSTLGADTSTQTP